MEELQYAPNAMAKSFRAGQVTVIGVALPSLNLFFGQVVHDVERFARARGVAMYLTCLGDDPDAEQAGNPRDGASRHMVGMVIAAISADQPYLKPWRNHTAMVFIDR